MSRLVEITKSGNNYTVNPNGSGGGTGYCWVNGYNWELFWFDFSIAPENTSSGKNLLIGTHFDSNGVRITGISSIPFSTFLETKFEGYTYSKVSDTSFELTAEGENTITITRNAQSDFTLWT